MTAPVGYDFTAEMLTPAIDFRLGGSGQKRSDRTGRRLHPPLT